MTIRLVLREPGDQGVSSGRSMTSFTVLTACLYAGCEGMKAGPDSLYDRNARQCSLTFLHSFFAFRVPRKQRYMSLRNSDPQFRSFRMRQLASGGRLPSESTGPPCPSKKQQTSRFFTCNIPRLLKKLYAFPYDLYPHILVLGSSDR